MLTGLARRAAGFAVATAARRAGGLRGAASAVAGAWNRWGRARLRKATPATRPLCCVLALCGQGGGAKHRRGAAKKTHPHKNPTDVPLFLSSSDAATDPPLGPDEIEAKGIRLAGAPVYLDMQVSGFFG